MTKKYENDRDELEDEIESGEGFDQDFELIELPNSASSLVELPKETVIIGNFESSRDKATEQEHLDELAELVTSYGSEVKGSFLCPLKKFSASHFIGSGKVEEIAKWIEENHIRLAVFDSSLTPSQQRNLEKDLKIAVADRTEIILGVFAKHAKTKEARLQIELAQIQHHLPRLTRLWTHLSRQRGGGANQKGEGETQIELDRRMLKRRLEFLKKQSEEVQQVKETKLQARERNQAVSFAIVGYTNAGKSTLMNALTHADVFVEDKLFATLDTTTRRYRLPGGTEALLVDTVGFIRKLPHLLVDAFRSTLNEAVQADILVHLIDGSHPCVESHIQATEEVLKQLGALSKERLIVFNKVDAMTGTQIMELKLRCPGAIFISSTTGAGLAELATRMEEVLSSRRSICTLRIPQEQFDLVNQIYRVGRVISTDYEGNDVLIKAELKPEDCSRLANYQVDQG
jgi:GTP-binding protein HflX